MEPAARIVCLTEETTEILYLLGESERIVGISAIVMAIALLSAYLPWSPSALIWPYEWAMLLTWTMLGGVLLLRYRIKQAR